MNKIEITVLTDNLCNNAKCIAEHGLSILLEIGNKKILFDTGQTNLLFHNAIQCQKSLNNIDFLILSHSHYDHVGGVKNILDVNPNLKIIVKQDIFKDKWSTSKGYLRRIGGGLENLLNKYPNEIIFINEKTEIINGVFIEPNISKIDKYNFIDPNLLFVDNNKLTTDIFSDELFLYISKNHYNIIFSGCAHNGITNIVDTAFNNFSDKHIDLLIGGTHLQRAEKQDVISVAEQLKKYNIKLAAFNHCTGEKNIEYLQNAAQKVIYAGAGSKFNYEIN